MGLSSEHKNLHWELIETREDKKLRPFLCPHKQKLSPRKLDKSMNFKF